MKYRSLVNRKSGFKRRYKKRAIMARPQRSLYDADCWIKVSHTVPIAYSTALGNNACYVSMRTDAATTAFPDHTWIDANEFQPYILLYNLAEIRGLKMSVTMGQFASTGNKIMHSAKIYAGPASGIPGGAIPDTARAQGLPVH